MSRFLRALLLFTFAFHIPFLLAAHAVAVSFGWPIPWLLALAVTGLGIALFAGRARGLMPDRKQKASLARAFDIPYFVHWCACVFTVLPSIVGTLVLLAIDLARGGGAALHGAFYGWTYVAGLVVCGYGILIRRRWFHTVAIDVPVTGLAKSYDGYRVAHLSDLHIGSFTPKSWGLKWAGASNAAMPDLVAVTGDLVTSGVDFHGDIAEVIGALKAKDGVVVSMGNHDYFGEGEPLISLLRATGARVLRNESMLLDNGAGKLHVAAIDDTWTRRADIDRALTDKPAGVATMLLAHDPAQFPLAAERGVALTIAGHTHGGQIAVPFLGRWLSLSHLAHKFHIGLYRDGNAALYVHPGLGTTGPPMRLGVAPAVVILTLRAT